MRRYDICCAVALAAACIAGNAVAQDDSMVVQAGEGSFTCEEAKRLKRNMAEYEKLSSEHQMQVDLQWQMCKPENTRPGAEKSAAIVRTKDKLGFGIFGKKDIRRLRNHCNNVKTGVNAVATVKDPVLGPFIAIGNTDTCKGIAEQMEKNNSLVLFAPGAVIGAYTYKTAAKFVLSGPDAQNVSNAIDKVLDKAPRITFGSASKEAGKVGEAAGKIGTQAGKDIKNGWNTVRHGFKH